MATNWSMKEATKAILAGDKEAIRDIGRRFPLTAVAIAKMGNNEGALEIINALPDHFSVRKIDSALKDGVQEDEDLDEEVEKEPEEEKPAKVEKKPRGKKKEKPIMNEPEDNDEEDYESMSEVELFKLCKKKGLKPAPKQNKDYYLDLLNPSSDNEEEDWDEEEEPVKKPAKKAAKKPAKKAAKEEDSDDDDDDDDDWDI